MLITIVSVSRSPDDSARASADARIAAASLVEIARVAAEYAVLGHGYETALCAG
jgi:hypothetical protein